MRSFEFSFILIGSSNAATQKAVIRAADSIMARKLFEQQNPGCRIVSTPREIR